MQLKTAYSHMLHGGTDGVYLVMVGKTVHMGLGMSSLVTWSWPRYFIACVPYLTEKYYTLGMLAIQPDKSASKKVICQVNIENINKQVEKLTEKKLEIKFSVLFLHILIFSLVESIHYYDAEYS